MNRRLTACVALAGLLALIFASASLAASGRPQPISKPATAHASAGAFHARTFAAPTVGETFNSTTGTWTESPTKFTYQWEDCNTSGLSCVAIAGATCVQIGPDTACPYTLQASDNGDTIVVLVTAYNAIGSASNSSLASGVVTAPVPVISSVPTVSGAVTQGSTLTATNGTWTNSPTGYATQWYECPTSCTGSNFTAISGAVGSTYITESTDVGDVLYATVTASNASGSGTPSSSTDTAVITAAAEAPVSTGTNPTIAGTAAQGDVLTATGTGATYWDNTPTSYTYQWAECPTACAGAGTHISGATSSTYTLQSSDIGDAVYVGITATNATGSATAYSTTVGPVTSGTGTGGNGTGVFTGNYTSGYPLFAPYAPGCPPCTIISSNEIQINLTTANNPDTDGNYRQDMLTASNWYPSGTIECTTIPFAYTGATVSSGGWWQYAEAKDSVSPHAGWSMAFSSYYSGTDTPSLSYLGASSGAPWVATTTLTPYPAIHTESICTNDSNSNSGIVEGIWLDGVQETYNHTETEGPGTVTSGTTVASGFPILDDAYFGDANVTNWPLDSNDYTGGDPIPNTIYHGASLIATYGTNGLPPEPTGGWNSF